MKRISSLVLAGLIVVGTSVAAFAEDWTQYRHDSAASGVNPTAAPIQANRWRVRWSKPNTNRLISTYPLIADGNVYVAGHKGGKIQLWSFDLATGQQRVLSRLPCGWLNPRLVMTGGMIVVDEEDAPPTCEDDLDLDYVVNAATGHKIAINPFFLGTVFDEDELLTIAPVSFPQPPFAIRRFNVHNQLFGPLTSEPFPWPSRLLFSNPEPLRVVDGEAWLRDAGPNGTPYGIAVADGIALVPAAPRGYVEARPLDGGPVVHWGECPANTSCALDVATHQVLWSGSTANEFATINDGVVYGDCGGFECARDLDTGALIWQSTTPSGDSLLVGGVLWVTGPTNIGLNPATGAVVSRRPFTQKLGPPGGFTAIADGYMVTVSESVGLKVITFDR